MRKYGALWAAVLLAILVLAACASKKPTKAEESIKAIDENVQLDYKIVEHKGSMFGASTPEMIRDSVIMSARDFAKKYFDGSYAFVSTEVGKDLDGLKSWAQNFSIQSAVSKKVSTSVETSFNGLETGTKDALGAAMETFTRVVSNAEFSGLSKENDWWFKRRHLNEDGSTDYTDFQYIVVYAIDAKLLDQQINALLNGTIADVNDRSAMDKLQERLATDGYGLDDGLSE